MSDRELIEKLAEVAPDVCEFDDPELCCLHQTNGRDSYFSFLRENGSFMSPDAGAIVTYELLDRLGQDIALSWKLSPNSSNSKHEGFKFAWYTSNKEKGCLQFTGSTLFEAVVQFYIAWSQERAHVT